MSGELSWQQLPIDTPSTAAFTLDGSFTKACIGDFTVNLGRSLQPLPKRLFLDIRGLKQIDRAGIDTMAGLAGLFSENDSGFLAIIGAPQALRSKLTEGAPDNSFRFYDSFGQAAQKVTLKAGPRPCDGVKRRIATSWPRAKVAASSSVRPGSGAPSSPWMPSAGGPV